MFPFFSRNKMSEESPVPAPAPQPKPQEAHPLDALTGGAFSAPTSGERASRVRAWLATEPTPDQLQMVFKELSTRDKGAARPLRERLDEIRRSQGQASMADEWSRKGQALLDASRLHIADALAWQRDAAKAGAPLSREPLSLIKARLADRVKSIEDLQHHVQVQREAAVLLAQRIEVLSTKPWQDAQQALDVLRTDVERWQAQAHALADDAAWASVEARFPPLLDASRGQLVVVWEAFQAALAQAVAAAQDPQAPLPAVPVWAEAIRAARGTVEPIAGADAGPRSARTARALDPAVRAQATQAVTQAVQRLEQETLEGHGKASAGAAAALRAVLKQHGKAMDTSLEPRVHAALVAAGELQGWQRWSADQVREDLVAKAEALVNMPQDQAPAGRKLQDTLRQLREQWKQVDQSAAPNHALWKRFDEACSTAYKAVEAWLDKVRAEAAHHKAQRLALIEELKAWAADHAASGDWKLVLRTLHQFGDRWRASGPVGEKIFAELQPLWKQALHTAAAPLEAAQKQSLLLRNAMIEEAQQLGASAVLRVDAIKALQQRWQAEAHAVPLDRKQEQKLWDAFRNPLDAAFARKTAEREKTAAVLSQRDRTVLDAAQALEQANASGDAAQIRAAMARLEQALHAQSTEPQAEAPTKSQEQPQADATQAPKDAAAQDGGQEPAPTATPKPARPVVAVRGDDRPGAKKDMPAVGRTGKPFDRKDRRDERFAPRDNRHDARYEDRGPRLGDAAFRAQREAIEHAQSALRKLAEQAHGAAVTQLLHAWEQRSADALPTTQEFGARVSAPARAAWSKALAAPHADTSLAAESLLRLEIAAEVPTPAEHLDARRQLQLQLLTRRNQPAPAQTWADDVARVLSSNFDAASARRMQAVLKVLARR